MTTHESQPQPNAPPPRPFQFSLASLLVFVTGVCVALSLIQWHSTFGLVVVIVEPAVGILIAFIGLVLSPVVATVTLPVSLPLAVACCAILRKVDPWRSKAGMMDLDRTMRSRRRAADMRLSGEYANPEEVMAAAFQHDRDGNWDAAVAIYAEVARRWPEHAAYARGRITEIEEKRSRME